MNSSIPTAIRKVFEPNPICDERILLDTEKGSQPKKNEVRVRALDGFVIVKDNKFVYPTYGKSTAEWWRGAQVYGYAAALTGEFKCFIWAGHWGMDYPGKHMEVVRIAQPQGLYKESSKHWRNNEEEILWLESAAGYSYALLEPAEEYDRGHWPVVMHSWTKLPEGSSQADPSFSALPHDEDEEKPSWWTSSKAWEHFMKPFKMEQKQEQERKRKKAAAERKKVEAERKATAKRMQEETRGPRKGKGKEKGQPKSPKKAPTTRDAASAGPSPGSKRKHSEPDYDTSRLRPRKPQRYVEIGEDEDEEKDTGEEEEEKTEEEEEKDAEQEDAGEDEDKDKDDSEASEEEPPRKRPRAKSPPRTARSTVASSPALDGHSSMALGEKPSSKDESASLGDSVVPAQQDDSLSAGAEAEGTKEPSVLGSQPTAAMRGMSIGDSSTDVAPLSAHLSGTVQPLAPFISTTSPPSAASPEIVAPTTPSAARATHKPLPPIAGAGSEGTTHPPSPAAPAGLPAAPLALGPSAPPPATPAVALAPQGGAAGSGDAAQSGTAGASDTPGSSSGPSIVPPSFVKVRTFAMDDMTGRP